MTFIACRKFKALGVATLGAVVALALTAAASPPPSRPISVGEPSPEMIISSSFSPRALSATVRRQSRSSL